MKSDNENVDSFHALIVFIGKIAEYDEFSRIIFCHKPEWDTLQMFTAYTTCAIKTDLKCDIFSALTAFGKSAESSAKLLTILAENCVLTIISAQHKMEERRSENKMCPLVDAILEFLSKIIMTFKLERPHKIDLHFKFITETILLTSYERYAN